MLIPSGLRPDVPTAIGSLTGAATALAAAELAGSASRPVVLLASDPRQADLLEAEIRFFADDALPILHFPEWETLPWDSFSPHQDIVSQRLAVLGTLPSLRRGILIASISTLLQRLPPIDYVAARTLKIRTGQLLDRSEFMEHLTSSAYLRVPQVSEHGEYAVRGSLIDVYPMGGSQPLRIDFFDDEVESLRWFDAETQMSGEACEQVNILPGREIPLDAADIKSFRHRYRERFEGQPSKSRVYREISDGIAHGGIEYYMPLFFDRTAGLTDYLPADSILVRQADLDTILDQSWQEISERFELCSLDPERPILTAGESFIPPQTLADSLGRFDPVT